MTVRRLVALTLVTGATAVAWLGCGGDPSGPSPASVTGVAGDNQVAPTGAQLEFPLSFVVLGTSGSPVSGVTVNWTVQSGSAFLNPTTSTTNASGVASTAVTLGGAIGVVEIRASVAGLAQPVTFHAEAIDPCAFLVPYTLGTVVTGSLRSGDCNIQGFYVDFYGFETPLNQQSLRINLSSGLIDSWVELYRSSHEFLGLHDDIDPGVNKNSRLDVVVSPGGSFYIAATSYDPGETGGYSLSAANRTAAFENCGLAWVTRGVTVTDAISTTDCADTTGGVTHYLDFIGIAVDGGTVLTISQTSAAINPRLELRSATGTLLTEAEGIAEAVISYSVTTSGSYAILPGTVNPGQTGAYTLTISSSTTGSPTAPNLGPRRWDQGAPQPLRFGSLRLPKGIQALPGLPGTH